MTIADFDVATATRETVSLAAYRGQVLLVVNVASRCGFTGQYAGLEALHRQYRDRGFSVLGFPCNQFLAQEPGGDEAIQSFCKLTYDVSFPVFGKIAVNGAAAAPLYRWLKESAPGLLGTRAIKWNFTKFLIGRDGNVVNRFAPLTKPAKLAGAIEAALAVHVE
jgi:glutathione peroxidase